MVPERLWIEAPSGEKPELHWECPKCKTTVSMETELRGFESNKMTIMSVTMPKTWFCDDCGKTTHLCVVKDVGGFDAYLDPPEED